MATKKTTSTKKTSTVSGTKKKNQDYSVSSDPKVTAINKQKAQNIADGLGSRGTNPVTSSSSVRADNNATANSIKGLKSAYAKDSRLLREQQALLSERRSKAVGDIKADYEVTKLAQETGQEREYASRSTQLVTSGGGFLGATQSQSGVLQNLEETHDSERTALFAKREAAINAAEAAYEDKDFALAKELSNSAKELEKEIYKRQTDFADQKLKLASEKRNQTEFDLGITDKKVASYAMLSDEEFADLSPDEIASSDALYYPGYTATARLTAKKALDVKTSKDAIGLDADILDMRLKIPYGQKFTLGGQSYTGLKQAEGGGGGTESERKQTLYSKINELLSNKKDAGGKPFYTIPGTDGVPYIDQNDYITPEGWAVSMRSSGLERTEFIKQYGYLIPPDGMEQYKLTNAEKDIIRGKI